jgi:hypothetical protein
MPSRTTRASLGADLVRCTFTVTDFQVYLLPVSRRPVHHINFGSRSTDAPKRKAAKRRLFFSKPIISGHAAINAGLNFRR